MTKHPNQWTLEEAAHLLNRAGFGGSPAEIAAFHGLGCEGAVEQILEGEARSDSETPVLETSAKEAQTAYAEEHGRRKKDKTSQDAEERLKFRRAAQKETRQNLRTLTHGWVHRMCLSEAPLQEKMVLFWHDHFPTSFMKVREPHLLRQQHQLFRAEALGSFRTLVERIAEDPAMMLYLDSAKSTKENPNENFARELLELFTLGEGNFEESDVQEAARAFTGKRVNRRKGEVFFVPRRWDRGSKTVLGKTGYFKGQDVIDIALSKVECGQYLAGKLWEYFCYDSPSRAVVEALGALFAKGDYELKPLLREIFLSEEFYAERTMRSQIKSPLEFLAMLNRQLELGPIPRIAVLPVLQQLGQTPFDPPNVAGWDWGKAWVNTNTLLTRYHYAGLVTGADGDPGQGPQFLNRRIQRAFEHPDLEKIAPRELREDIPALVESLAFRLFQAPLSEKDRAAFESYARAKKGVVFTNTEVAELLHLMMSTPTYQLT